MTWSLARSNCIRILSMGLVLASSSQIATAATNVDSADTSRPKIGLALSGGGARGAAHIGVLRVLEENNVPIHYIAGTSMGSIVGGLYSSGMSPDDIEAGLASINWDSVFDDLPPRSDRSFRRKRDDDLYLVKAKPGFNDGKIDLPSGLVQGQKIDLELARLSLPVATVDNFDNLMIPFRAVATDIATGEEVAIGSGNLGEAIRASMSIPAAFAPAVLDGRLLVDGGTANNLPINVVRAMGADIVIAIDISTPLLKQEEIDSVLLITQQLTGLLTRRNVEEQIKTLTDKDIFIVPDLGDVSTSDFKDFRKAIPPGRAATEAQLDVIRKLSLPDDEYRTYQTSLKHPGRERPVIDRIALENNSRLSDAYIMSRVVDTEVGKPLDVEALETDLGKIYGLELFQNVRYSISEENEETVLNIRADERAWGPGYLQFGAEYDSAGEGESLFNLAVTYLKTGLNTRGGEWRSGVQIGSEYALFTEFHQPFGATLKYFVNPAIAYQERLVNIVQGSQVSATYRIKETPLEFSFGREFGTWGEARVGVRYSDGEAEREVGDPSFSDIPFERGETFVRLSSDELDDFNIPLNGTAFRAEWLGSRDGLGADTEFDQLSLNANSFFTRNRNTFGIAAQYNATISGTAPIQSLFTLGGFGRLSGLTESEISGQHAAFAGLIYYRHLNESATMPIYAGMSLETGNAWNSRSDISLSDSITAGSLFLAINTLIGPLYLAYGRAEDSNDALYFFLGRPF
ncbi:MAG: patatin-like phospholipase family protein [Woeseiaceae bacterium]